MQNATGDACGSHEFGDASTTEGPPHAAVSHANPSSVSNGDWGVGDSAVVGAADGDDVDSTDEHAATAPTLTTAATTQVTVRSRDSAARSAMRSCLPNSPNNV
jgi:hypothetical protein